MHRLLMSAALIALSAPAFAEQAPPPAGSATGDWSPARATGPNDVPTLGDSPNAWATASADAGAEWLKLGYPEAMPIKEIRIWQNDAPGAIARVTVTVDGQEVEVWKGRDTVEGATKPVEKVITLAKPYTSDTVTVHLDTARVTGWNEIDAVQIVATDGQKAWASTASGSSTYASATGAAAHPLGHLMGKTVSVRADGVSLTGVVTALDHTWITLKIGDRTALLNQQRVAVIEWKD